jgi:hypothetical protein
MSTAADQTGRSARPFRPVAFADGHALTFTVREIHDPAGEFLSHHHDRRAAAHAFALSQKHARYAELRDTNGAVIADYVRGDGPALIAHDTATGCVTREEWYRNGHRVAAPQSHPLLPGPR